MSELVTTAYPATLFEVAYLRAEREQRPYYMVQRGEEIGITSELQEGDEVISIYEAD